MKDNFKKLYSAFLQPELIEEIEEIGVFKSLEAGNHMMEFGQYVKSVPLVIKGSIKVLRADQEGNELLLYFLHPRETCAMSLACCLGHKKSEIKAVAETDVELMTVPVQKIEEWASRYKSWRNFVFDSYYSQLMDAFKAIDSIAFSKLDERLLEYLKRKKQISGLKKLKITHQEIANDLNSSRVVISRLLKQLERENTIELKHNLINLENL